LEGGLAAKNGLQKVHQLHPEMEHINALRQYQPQVQGELKPATGKNQLGERAEARIFGLGFGLGVGSHG
jgi:hypothetical protein